MEELFSLKGKIIVVTGATGTLGTAFVDGIINAGATVAMIGRDEKKGAQAVDRVTKTGGTASFFRADVLSEDEVSQVREKILEAFGGVHGIVNAAGGNVPEGILPPDMDVFDMKIEGMQRAMDLNIWGTLIPVKIFGPALTESGKGSIVNISSVSSKRSLSRVLGYSMGKAAIDIYTKWMAVEIANRYGDALRVNSITPGFFLSHQNESLLKNPDGSWTERASTILRQTPFRRFGHPNELVGALIWLLSDASQFVTGTEVSVDGGFMINSGV